MDNLQSSNSLEKHNEFLDSPVKTIPQSQIQGNPSTIALNPAQQSTHQQKHIQAGEYLKSFVYGGLDGTVNTLTIIVGGIASNTLPRVIMAIGLSALVGDALGMGLGDYLSAKAQKQFIQSQEKRQLWEVENKLEDEKNQVVEIYMQKNYPQHQAKRLADLFATNHQAFVNIMMLQELGLVVDDSNPMIGGLITGLAFIVLGIMPLLPYLIKHEDDTPPHLLACLLIGGFELIGLGLAKAFIIRLNWKKVIIAAVQTLALGAGATAAGYAIGLAFEHA